jgi:heparinase II/III-like protein
MRHSKLILLLLLPSLTTLGSCGGGGGSPDSGAEGGQEAGSPPDSGNSDFEVDPGVLDPRDREYEDSGGGSLGDEFGAEEGPYPGEGEGEGTGEGEGGGNTGVGSGGNGLSGGSGIGEGGSGEGNGSGEGDGSGSGSGSGEGSSEGGGGGASNSTASVASWDQDGGRLSLTLDVAGDGEVTLVVTEGDQSESVLISSAGSSEHDFRIPRRGAPLTERAMTIEAFDSTGALLAMQEVSVIEPLDLPQHSMLALNQTDQTSLQSRMAAPGRTKRVIGELIARADARLTETLFVPSTKGEDGNGYRCPDHGDALTTIDPAHHECPVDGYVYGPTNTAAELYNLILGAYNSILHRELSEEAFEMGVAYLLSGDMAYAERTADILTGYADVYLGYTLNDKKGRTDSRQTARVLSQSLDEARWLIRIARATDLIRGSGALTAAEETAVAEQLLQPSLDLLRSKREAWNYHNIQCWHNSAVFLAAMLNEDYEAAREALYGEFGLLDQLAYAQESEFMWAEGSFGYHFFAVRGMLPMMLAMRRASVAADGTPLREMMLAPVKLIQPDGSFPLLNDTAYKSLATNVKDIYEMAVALFNDRDVAGPLTKYGRGNTLEGIVYGLSDVPAGGWKEPESINFETPGIAALRSGPLVTQTMALVDYGPHGGDHGHYDKFGLTVWIGGVPLIREGGHIGYKDPWYRGWYQRTLAHSTVLRDGLDQDALADSADLLRFTKANGSTLLEVRTSEAYPSSTLQRLTLTTANRRFVDMFEVTGNATRTYDYVLHFEGEVSTDLAMKSTANDLGYGGAYAFLKNMQIADTDQDFELILQTAGGARTVRVLGSPGTTVFLGDAIGFPSNRKHPVLVLRRTTQSTVFAVVGMEGVGLPQGMSIAHIPNARELTIEEPESGVPVTISLQ